VAPGFEPEAGDMSWPSQRAATLTVVGGAWQHGRFWVNDPDCLIVRPAVERREQWARTVERYGGLRASSDRIADLDQWGLETIRRLLASPPPPRRSTPPRRRCSCKGLRCLIHTEVPGLHMHPGWFRGGVEDCSGDGAQRHAPFN
jgi:hypothetical protein